MAIPTVNSLHRATRRLDRRNKQTHAVLSALRDGAVLQLQYRRGRRVWTLGGPRAGFVFVDDDLALELIGRTEIVSVGDCLFAGTLAQTYRHVSV